MRKLFRMKYEACNGQCYEYSDVMRIHALGLDTQGAVAFLKRLVAMHEPSCGNAELQFRLDEDTWIPKESASQASQTRFVASFYHYGSLDLFGGATPLEAMNKLIDAALAYYQTDEYKAAVTAKPGAGHGVCHHGDDKKLVEFAISFSGLPPAEQDALRAAFA